MVTGVTPLMPAITVPHATTTIFFFFHNHKLPQPLTNCTPVGVGTLRLQVYLWFPEFLKVEWAAEPSVIRPLSGVGRRVAGVNTLHLLTVMLDISKSSVLYRSHRAVER